MVWEDGGRKAPSYPIRRAILPFWGNDPSRAVPSAFRDNGITCGVVNSVLFSGGARLASGDLIKYTTPHAMGWRFNGLAPPKRGGEPALGSNLTSTGTPARKRRSVAVRPFCGWRKDGA